MGALLLALAILGAWALVGFLALGGWVWLATAPQRRREREACPVCGTQGCRFNSPLRVRTGVGE